MSDIPAEQYAAMRRICDPMIKAAYAMSAEDLENAMRGFYATSDSNCPWFVFALRHTMPPLLATIGEGKDGYSEAWGIAQPTPPDTPEEGA